MFVSYAQNFEDVLLWRVFKDVKDGFYIDVGAQDPINDSISLAFYEHGWRGVHVEPVPTSAAKLRAHRPDEEVVETAIASEEGTLAFFEVPDTGLSTGKEDVAQRHSGDGFEVRQLRVPSIRLSTLLDRYAGKPIHWLKIDVEEMERDVITSWVPSAVRPWVVLVESTRARSQEPNHFEWEADLLALGYEFAHFDGLNRFYVHTGQIHLKTILGLGPNFFDDFAVGGNSPYARKLNADIADLERREAEEMAKVEELAKAVQAMLEREGKRDSATNETQAWQATSAALSKELTLKNQTVEALTAQLEDCKLRIAELETSHSQIRFALQDQFAAHHAALSAKNAEIENRDGEIAELHGVVNSLTLRAAELDRYFSDIHGSTSWRATAPLRALKKGGDTALRWPQRQSRMLFARAVTWAIARPRLKSALKSAAYLVPSIERRAREAVINLGYGTTTTPNIGGKWIIEPDPVALGNWETLLGAPHNERKL